MVLVCRSGNRDLNQCVELTDRESSVYDLICASQGPASFSRLMKSSALHQEILSRIIQRLVVYGAVKKVEGGYRRAFS